MAKKGRGGKQYQDGTLAVSVCIQLLPNTTWIVEVSSLVNNHILRSEQWPICLFYASSTAQ